MEDPHYKRDATKYETLTAENKLYHGILPKLKNSFLAKKNNVEKSDSAD